MGSETISWSERNWHPSQPRTMRLTHPQPIPALAPRSSSALITCWEKRSGASIWASTPSPATSTSPCSRTVGGRNADPLRCQELDHVRGHERLENSGGENTHDG